MTRKYTPLERFEAFMCRFRVDEDDNWIWLGYINEKGYGTFKDDDGKQTPAHRYAYEVFKGQIPEDKPQLDHLCRIRACVNPDHLEPVTNKENSYRGIKGPQAFCFQNHLMSGENLGITPKGHRYCKECHKLRYIATRIRQGKQYPYIPPENPVCKRGHPLSGSNLGMIVSGEKKGNHFCKTCKGLVEMYRKRRARYEAKYHSEPPKDSYYYPDNL